MYSPHFQYEVTMKCMDPECTEEFADTKSLLSHWKVKHNPKNECPVPFESDLHAKILNLAYDGLHEIAL